MDKVEYREINNIRSYKHELYLTKLNILVLIQKMKKDL